jgi:hypothetical protein
MGCLCASWEIWQVYGAGVSRLYLVPVGKAGDEGYICGNNVGDRCIGGEEMACCS